MAECPILMWRGIRQWMPTATRNKAGTWTWLNRTTSTVWINDLNSSNRCRVDPHLCKLSKNLKKKEQATVTLLPWLVDLWRSRGTSIRRSRLSFKISKRRLSRNSWNQLWPITHSWEWGQKSWALTSEAIMVMKISRESQSEGINLLNQLTLALYTRTYSQFNCKMKNLSKQKYRFNNRRTIPRLLKGSLPRTRHNCQEL